MTAERQCPRVNAISRDAISRISAGGAHSIIVIVIVSFQNDAKCLGDEHHGYAAQKAKSGSETKPGINAEVTLDLDQRLGEDGRGEYSREKEPDTSDADR